MTAHEQLVARRGRRSGVTTMVAIHSTALGPAVGGCRLKPYADLTRAVDDVLRLSAAMTAKCAVAGLAFGGGKSVIALEPGRVLSPEERRDVLLDHADLVAEFGGTYLAGPDVGTGPADMLVLREVSAFAFCTPESAGGTGSSSGPTAVGVLAALRAALGSPDMTGRRVVISGYGSVGAHLAASLHASGADVVVSDIDPAKRADAESGGLTWVEPEKALTLTADVVIPAAIGGVLSPETVARLDTPLVVGPANNQLTDDAVADDLAARGVLWVPDYVASAGGILYTLSREAEGLDHDAALARVETIERTVEDLLKAAQANATTPLHEAAALAGRRLTSGAAPRTP
ncbi:Glu/Leu/Phe/Val dehydrogenase dimerization domain-containing protein [Amycolatopsis mongoliensis]|uniref:Glu/Leu/Phe/Val dehydrogenase dimerization domain-containing protein n=1 Tax=Amycolatopsis mongoliensis TaxID=715475 RepID=A0A9Y2JXX5_9PSEU|nr:Glu/Leu/Phe/Val dehydrogenase dimerization domain-containing protein [Amycolatopsis sp. 4-36]WIY06733.1 Glu/Leu/Phe/Val dehydrogenase dimerization domain-containing protein [Amycolatopsis sp. 4-36]